MKKAWTKGFAATVLGGMTLLTGCSRTFEVAYQADAARLSNAEALAKYKVGVGKFEDKRRWVEAGDLKTESYVSTQGAWKFGMTYKKNDYAPVKDVVQDVLVEEFSKAGINATAVNRVAPKSKPQPGTDLGSPYDFMLGGEILAFDFRNDTGFWSIDSYRTARLHVNLVRNADGQTLLDAPIEESDKQTYALAVAHSVNIYNLVNEVLKKAAHGIVQKVAAAMAPPDPVKQDVQASAPAGGASGVSSAESAANDPEKPRQ